MTSHNSKEKERPKKTTSKVQKHSITIVPASAPTLSSLTVTTSKPVPKLQITSERKLSKESLQAVVENFTEFLDTINGEEKTSKKMEPNEEKKRPSVINSVIFAIMISDKFKMEKQLNSKISTHLLSQQQKQRQRYQYQQSYHSQPQHHQPQPRNPPLHHPQLNPQFHHQQQINDIENEKGFNLTEILKVVCEEPRQMNGGVIIPPIPITKLFGFQKYEIIRDLEIIQMNNELRNIFRQYLYKIMIQLKHDLILQFDTMDILETVLYRSNSKNSLNYNDPSVFSSELKKIGLTLYNMCEYIKICKILQTDTSDEYKLRIKWGLLSFIETISNIIYQSNLPIEDQFKFITIELEQLALADPIIGSEIQNMIRKQLLVNVELMDDEARKQNVTNSNPSPILLVAKTSKGVFVGHTIDDSEKLNMLSFSTEEKTSIELPTKETLPKEIPNEVILETSLLETSLETSLEKSLKTSLFYQEYENEKESSFFIQNYNKIRSNTNNILGHGNDILLTTITSIHPLPEQKIKRLKSIMMTIASGCFFSFIDEYINNQVTRIEPQHESNIEVNIDANIDANNEHKQEKLSANKISTKEKSKQQKKKKQKINQDQTPSQTQTQYHHKLKQSEFLKLRFENRHLKMNTHIKPLEVITDSVEEANQLTNCANPAYIEEYTNHVQKFIRVYKAFGAQNLRSDIICFSHKFQVIGSCLPSVLIDLLTTTCCLLRINDCYETRGTVSDLDILDEKRYDDMILKGQRWKIRKSHLALLSKLYRNYNPICYTFTTKQLLLQDASFKLFLDVDQILYLKRSQNLKWIVHIDLAADIYLFGYPFKLEFQFDQTKTCLHKVKDREKAITTCCFDSLSDEARNIPCKILIYDKCLLYQFAIEHENAKKFELENKAMKDFVNGCEKGATKDELINACQEMEKKFMKEEQEEEEKAAKSRTYEQQQEEDEFYIASNHDIKQENLDLYEEMLECFHDTEEEYQEEENQEEGQEEQESLQPDTVSGTQIQSHLSTEPHVEEPCIKSSEANEIEKEKEEERNYDSIPIPPSKQLESGCLSFLKKNTGTNEKNNDPTIDKAVKIGSDALLTLTKMKSVSKVRSNEIQKLKQLIVDVKDMTAALNKKKLEIILSKQNHTNKNQQ